MRDIGHSLGTLPGDGMLNCLCIPCHTKGQCFKYPRHVNISRESEVGLKEIF